MHYIEKLFHLEQLIREPTRVTLSSSTMIMDLILPCMSDNHIKSGVHKVALSDHYMVYTLLNFPKQPKEYKVIRFREYKDFNQHDNLIYLVGKF